MIRELSLEGFYNWHLRKLDFEAGVFGPNVLCKVCARANRAEILYDNLDIAPLDASDIPRSCC